VTGGARRARRRQPGPHYRWVALSNTTLGVLMATINQSIVLIALPDIFRGIGLNPLSPANTSYLLWIMMGFLVVSAVLVVSFGRLGDMYGRVRMYNIGFAIFTVASIALTVTWMHGTRAALWLIVWRVVQGIGGAFLFANSTAILTDAFPPNKRGTALGLNAIAAIAGSFLGLLLGGVLAPHNWHLVFLVSAPFGAFGTIWAYLMLHDIGARRRARMDWWGNILFGAGLIAILVGITYGLMPYGGSPMGWRNPWVLGGIGGGLAALLVFLLVETKVAEPLFRLSLFRIRAFAAGNLANLMLALGRGGMQFVIIIWLQGIWLPLHGYSFADTPLWAGIYMVPLTVGFLVSAPLSGILSDRFGARAFTVGGAALTAASFVGLMLLPVNFPYWEFAAVLAFNGFSSGLFASPNRAEIMNSVPADQRGAAGGIIATFQNAAFVLSIGVFFTLIVAGLSASLPSVMSSGLVAQGVPASAAHQVASLPPIAVLFAAFLGYNPMRQLLGPLLSHMPAGHAAYLAGRQFFPHLIISPFHSGLAVAFWFAIAANVVAAVASLLTGRRRKDRAETRGAELAAVAGEGGLEPAELVRPQPPSLAPAAAYPNAPGGGHPAGNGAALAAGDERAPVLLRAATGAPAAGRPAVLGQVLQADGVPVSGAAVTVIDMSGRQAGRDRTGPDGAYYVPVPGPGTCTLIVMADGQEPYAGAVRVGAGPTEREVRLPGGGGIAGTVCAAESGSPLPGATVTLLGRRGEVVAARASDQAGGYRFEGVAAGSYILAVSAPSCQPSAVPLVITAGAVAAQDAVLCAYARLEGRALTAAGAAVPDARVMVLDGNGNTVAVTTTGADGRYRLDSLPGGEYTVVASGYPPVASTLAIGASEPRYHEVELGHPEA
jgi:MFS family permease